MKALELVGHELNESISEIAAQKDDTEALTFLYSFTTCPMGKEALFAYARNGNLEMIRQLTGNGTLVFGWKVVSIAVIFGHLHILQYAKEKRISFGAGKTNIRAEKPSSSSSYKYSWFRQPVSCAIYHGNVDSLNWLLANGWQIDKDAMCAAIDGGRDSMFKAIAELNPSPSFDYYLLKFAERSTLPSVQQWYRWTRDGYKRGIPFSFCDC